MSWLDIVIPVISAALAGGLASILSAISQNKKAKAETKAIAEKTGPEVEDLTVGTMAEVITNLRADNQYLREDRDRLRKRLVEMEEKVVYLQGELDKLHGEISDLLRKPPAESTDEPLEEQV